MATKNDNVVASIPDPNSGAPPPRKKVTPRSASSPAAGAPAVTLSTARLAIRATMTAVAQAIATATPVLRTLPVNDQHRVPVVSATHAAVIPDLVQLLGEQPDLVPGVTPSTIEEAVALAADLRQLDLQLKEFEKNVALTGRLTLADAWTPSREVYAAAQRRAKTSTAFATRIEPLRLALRQGPKADAAQRRLNAAQAKHARAQDRATAAQNRAAAAQQRADMAKMAATIAASGHSRPAPTPAPAPAATPAPAPTTPK